MRLQIDGHEARQELSRKRQVVKDDRQLLSGGFQGSVVGQREVGWVTSKMARGRPSARYSVSSAIAR